MLDTANVTNMGYMFTYCSNLVELDLSSFNTANVTNMNSMFDSCSMLETIYASNLWSNAKCTSSYSVFYQCNMLKGGNGTAYNSSYTGGSYAVIDTVETPGYLTLKQTA